MHSNMQMEKELIRLTREVVRSFCQRCPQKIYSLMSESFMFIGGCDHQWAESLDAFKKLEQNQAASLPVSISDEQFHLLAHRGNLWILYGRYNAAVVLDHNTVIAAHVRGTYVWQKNGGKLELLHIHGSHSADIPPGGTFYPPPPRYSHAIIPLWRRR